MRKKWIRLIAAAVGSFLLAGCGADTQIDDYATNAGAESVQQTAGTESAATTTATEGIPKDEIKVGVLHLSDPAEGSGYTYTHDLGIQGMQQNLGLSDDQANAFPEVAPNIILDGHTLGAIQVVITDEAWDSLTPEQQDVLTEAGEYASQYNRQISQETEDKILEELKADGVNVIEVDDITPWQDACKDVIEEATKNNKELYQQIVDMQ